MPPRCRFFLYGTAALMTLLSLAQCTQETAPADYVARVGDQYLTDADVQAALTALPARRDSADARRQLIEQWVAGALLYREAQRRGLQNDSAVQKQLAQSRRSVLKSALITQMYEEAPPPSRAEVQAYYEEHQAQFRLRAPFVRLHYLTTATADSARQVQQALSRAATPAQADSLWPGLVRAYAAHPQQARALSTNYVDVRQLFTSHPALQTLLRDLQPGETAPVVQRGGQYHVLQLAERAPAGTVPPLQWIEGQVRERLLMQTRKQMIARQVQRLRNEATSHHELDLP